MIRLKRSAPILIADDDEDDREMIQDAIKESRLINSIHCVKDGEEMMDYLQNLGKYKDQIKNPFPGLILLDLNMPRMDGREALREIKTNLQLRQIPVVVLTTSQAEVDILRTYELGANSFITKPVLFGELVKVIKIIGHYWFEIVELPDSECKE